MAGLEYENWDDVHYCPTPPICDVAGKRSLKPGGEWTCPDCGAVHVVARVDRTSVQWISFGPGRPTRVVGGQVPDPSLPLRLDLRPAGGPLIAYAASGRAQIISGPEDAAPTAPAVTGLRGSDEPAEKDQSGAAQSDRRW